MVFSRLFTVRVIIVCVRRLVYFLLFRELNISLSRFERKPIENSSRARNPLHNEEYGCGLACVIELDYSSSAMSYAGLYTIFVIVYDMANSAKRNALSALCEFIISVPCEALSKGIVRILFRFAYYRFRCRAMCRMCVRFGVHNFVRFAARERVFVFSLE